MTNHEKYKKAFSVLQTSESSFREVKNMARLQKRTKMKSSRYCRMHSSWWNRNRLCG